MNWLLGGLAKRPSERAQEAEVPKPTPVTLHIYDVSGHSAVTGANRFFRAIGTGAYHAGVEIHGTEWSFGCSDGGFRGSGIFNCDPKGCGCHEYRESKEMGMTMMMRSEVQALLIQLAEEWSGDSYDLLRHNCCHFCDGFTQRLGVGPCPRWLTNLAGVGAMLRSGVRLVAAAPAAMVGGGGASPSAEVQPWLSPVKEDEYSWPGAGDIVEIYSNSQSVWLKGKVDSRDKDMVTVCYSLNGGAANKTLPAAHKDLRAWKGRVAADGISARASKGGYSGGEDKAAKVEPLKVAVSEGDPIEVYSNSTQAWCKGYVEKINGNMITLAYQNSNSEGCDWSRKSLPSEHNSWRKGKPGSMTMRSLGEAANAPDANELDVGDSVEVYSNSKRLWCPGLVTQRRRDVATICFQLPGSGPEEWLEKDIRLDSKDLRRQTSPSGQQSSPSLGKEPLDISYTGVEMACYDCEFAEVEGNASVSKVAEHIARSQLPRRTLKEIWQVANPEGKDPLGRAEFFRCCRLIGHCQALAEDTASTPASVTPTIVLGNDFSSGGCNRNFGSKLHEFLQQAPRRLPDFYSWQTH